MARCIEEKLNDTSSKICRNMFFAKVKNILDRIKFVPSEVPLFLETR